MRRRSNRLLVTVLLRVGAVLGLLLAYGPLGRFVRGPDARWQERLRRAASRLFGRVLHERAGPRSMTDAEYAGRVALAPAELERVLWDEGFVRNLLSRAKTRDGRVEYGSWVQRQSPLARRQLHVMLFAAAAGGTHVYAHEEYSSVNPLVAPAHFAGEGQDPALGVALARARLPVEFESP